MRQTKDIAMRTFSLLITGLLSIITPSSVARSWPDSPAQRRLAQTDTPRSDGLVLAHYFHKVDPRQTFAQYAKSTGQTLESVKQQFSAVGALKCFLNGGYEEITSNVVGRKDLIAGAAHVFFNDDCSPRDVRKCEFRVLNQPRRIFKIDTVAINACTRGKLNSKDDWFVAELTSPTTAIPYLVPEAPVILKMGAKLVQVAYQAANGWRHKPNVVLCSVRNVEYRLMPYLTDCSVGHGASGAAQLRPAPSRNRRWILTAVTSSQNESGHDGGEFDLTATYTSSAPVAGEFWQALADKLKNTPEAFEKASPPQSSTVFDNARPGFYGGQPSVDNIPRSQPIENPGAFPWSDCMRGCGDH